MAVYTGKQSINDAALGEFADYGFSLENHGETSELYFKDKRIAVFNAAMLTIPVLQDGCRNFLINMGRE